MLSSVYVTQVKSLQAFVQEEKGSVEKGTMDQMLAETEAMQKQAHMFQQERDQAYMALQQKQSEGLSMQNQVLDNWPPKITLDDIPGPSWNMKNLLIYCRSGSCKRKRRSWPGRWSA